MENIWSRDYLTLGARFSGLKNDSWTKKFHNVWICININYVGLKDGHRPLLENTMMEDDSYMKN